MSPMRPDLVEAWVFRIPPEHGNPEFLLIERAPDRIFPGIWQPVTGGIVDGEPAPWAALREVEEETGYRGDDVAVFYDLDQVGSWYDEAVDAIVNSVIFAVRVRPDVEPRLSEEHARFEWVEGDEAIKRSIWPPYRQSVELISRIAGDPGFGRWFQLDPEGRRIARPPEKGRGGREAARSAG